MAPSYFGIPTRTLVLAFVAGLALRLGFLAFLDYQLWTGDAVGYDALGWNLAAHGTFAVEKAAPFVPTVVRAPLLPLELALLYSVFGHTPLPAQLLQIVLTSTACVVLALAVAKVERRSTPDAPPRVATWTLWLAALCPFDAAYAGHLLSEALCTTCLLLALAAPVLLPRFGWLACGFFLGGAALARDVFLPLVPLFVAGIFVSALRKRAPKHAAVMLALGAVLAIAPWTARNYRATGEVVVISRGLGLFNLWVGTWERNGEWQSVGLKNHLPDESYRSPEEKEIVTRVVFEDDYVKRDVLLRKLVGDRLREEPLRVLWTWTKRSYKPWIGTRFDLFAFRPSSMAYGTLPWKLFKVAAFGLNAAGVVLGAWGLVLVLRARSHLAWFATPVLYCALIHVPFHNVESRYTQPVYAFLLVFVAVTLTTLSRRFFPRTSPVPAPSPSVMPT